MKAVLLVTAVLMVVAGGLQWAGGSALLGPLLAGLGVALAIVVAQRARS